MEKIAILIDASDVAGEKDLPGARVDIANWVEFLESPLGGGWRSWEIVQLHKPLSTQVSKVLEEHSKKYCLVAFSGHGCEGAVALNDWNKDCSISFLTPKGERGTLIIDSCRGIDKAKKFSSSITKSAGVLASRAGGVVLANARDGDITNFSALEESSKLEHVRKWDRISYDTALNNSQRGLVKMLACSAGEAAGEDPESGGYYTSALLDAAVAFERDINKDGILSTLQAHDYAAAIMPPNQRPEYSPRTSTFPFAVK